MLYIIREEGKIYKRISLALNSSSSIQGAPYKKLFSGSFLTPIIKWAIGHSWNSSKEKREEKERGVFSFF